MAAQQKNRIMDTLQKYINGVKAVYGAHLKKVILYGSYARGDYTADSDIDIMILVDLNEIEIRNLRNKLSDITFDINCENDVLIMPIVQNEAVFEKWVGALPFYNNVNNEGVELYVS